MNGSLTARPPSRLPQPAAAAMVNMLYVKPSTFQPATASAGIFRAGQVGNTPAAAVAMPRGFAVDAICADTAARVQQLSCGCCCGSTRPVATYAQHDAYETADTVYTLRCDAALHRHDSNVAAAPVRINIYYHGDALQWWDGCSYMVPPGDAARWPGASQKHDLQWSVTVCQKVRPRCSGVPCDATVLPTTAPPPTFLCKVLWTFFDAKNVAWMQWATLSGS